MTTPSHATNVTGRVLLAAAMLLALTAAPADTGLRAADVAKPPAIHPPAGHSHTVPRPRPTNPHVAVQGVKKPAVTATPHTTPHAKTITIHARTVRSHIRIARPSASRAGRGTIAGFVRTGDYRPVGGVFVRLAKPGGHRFRNAALRHGTYTRNDGSFVMRAVRGGRYRVNASKRGVGHGFTPAHLASAGHERVTIDLTAAPAKHRRHK